MRLIDADAFSEQLNSAYEYTELGEVIEMLDNAPTVEPPKWQYEFAKKLFEKVRPRGEWLTHRVAFHLTCPFCGCNLRALKDKVFEGDYEYNFCPNCGADMRVKGGGE